MTPIARLFIPSFALFTVFTATMDVGSAAPLKDTRQAAISTSAQIPPTSLLDINSASLTDLRSLPGVGAIRAQKVVAGRPYSSIDELKTRKVLPKSTYDKIRDRIKVVRSAGAAASEHQDISAPLTGRH